MDINIVVIVQVVIEQYTFREKQVMIIKSEQYDLSLLWKK